ncbi:ubiquitin interaction domain-containing protein [Colletotrichum tamarilloi]|uniref:Ubiquitin interaction domain-containing protein n=1 Tax=Colletotrichum tamarilloi TaxID=1209934 RepID=A0ABQ9QW24_9PEZI|nr:ubiquitin interaction domain-containing protein [Colletotrichum tamarilloi]KAK1487035.1 ubiquitin interaction domain-containing protein [Colletotrichum tamarilloi]
MSSHNNRARPQSPSADDDPDLALAIALSLQQEEFDNDDRTKAASSATKLPTSSATNTGPLGLLALDRKKMEEERIARLKKRSAAEAGIDTQSSQSLKLLRPGVSETHKVTGTAKSKAATPAISATPAANPLELPFSKGAFKRTWAFGCPRNGEDIKIEEVLQKDKLQLAVLSSFQWDEEWLLSKVNVRNTKMLLVAYANNDAEKANIRSNIPAGSLIKFCFPPMHGGYMHSKLQILKYEGCLRIVIPSGNLVPYDWGETGQLENMIFLIDLPRLNGPPIETSFGTELRRFLRALGLDDKLVKSLDNYDFSETSRYGFVHSISGSHTKEAWQHTGQSTPSARDAMTSCYCGLGSIIRSLGLATENAVDIDYVASSLGSLNHGFLTMIYYACQGDSGMKEYEARQSKMTKSKAAKTGLGGSRPVDIDKEPLQLQHHFRIYFPTEKTVSSSRGGRSSAGTICMQEKWWNSSTFPRELMRDCQSARGGLLLHSKAIFVRERAHDGAVWAYVGSANLSESAWGRLVKDRESGTAKLTCRNWECGVLVAVKDSSASTGDQDAQAQSRPQAKAQTVTLEGHAESEETLKGKEGTTAAAAESMGKRRHQQLDQDGSVGLDGVFGATMPIPMRVPARRYTSDESAASRPWFFMKAG